MLYSLGSIILDIPITDLQNALGKSGAAGIAPAMASLSRWITNNPEFQGNALTAIQTINSLTPASAFEPHIGRNDINASPYSILAFFLCHIVLWAFASVATSSQKQELQRAIEIDAGLNASAFCAVMKRALRESDVLGGQDSSDRRRSYSDAPKILFRSAAEVLMRLGTWGSSLSLAMLLHQRAKM